MWMEQVRMYVTELCRMSPGDNGQPNHGLSSAVQTNAVEEQCGLQLVVPQIGADALPECADHMYGNELSKLQSRWKANA
jgi:hypothetical protein